MGDVALRPIRQHRHEPVTAVEGDGVQPPLAVIAADFPCKGQQRAFHRVALDRPDPFLAMKGGVVAQRRCPGEGCQITRRSDDTFGCITLATDGKGPVRRFDRRYNHFVPGQGAGLVGADDRD